MNNQPVYLSPAVIDLVTMAQSIYEGRIAGAALTAVKEVRAVVGDWRPEVNQAACRFWEIFEAGHIDNLADATMKAGLFFDIAYWLSDDKPTYLTSEEVAKMSLYRWRCCKAARLGLSAIADDPSIGEIIERSHYGRK